MLDKRYQTLIVLVENKSFTKTAKRLFITQPAVSQQIASLESELNFPIVIRTHHQIEITSAGLELAKFAKKITFESQKLIASLQQASHSFKMGCTLSLSATLLPQFLHHLSSKTSVVATRINNTEHILQDIRNGKVDFGLVEGNFNKDEFDSFFLQQENFICVSHQEIPADTIEGLFTTPLLIREKGSGSRQILENWLGTQNLHLSDFEKTLEIASPSTIIELLKSNIGISFMYESLVKIDLKAGRLKKLSLPGFNIEHPINLVFVKNSYFKDTYKRIINSFLEQTDQTTNQN
ncbi:LysR substrate-binding domain-containing protein [Companilactobacillus sp. FL22-1]|uniref:LysR substrate-binding domain-containing protein n=1 Tax=Companilactobacillus sp. FL22-1 TaxID=3373892 RepID=UPI00375419A9